MDSISLKVSGLEYKVRKLIEQKKSLDSRVATLVSEIALLKQTIDEQLLIIRHQEKELSMLKTGRSISGESDATEAKERINELIREIDRCIMLLNE